MQPPLTTARLRLRPVTASDVDALWTLWSDPEVRRYLWDDRTIARDEAAATLDDCIALAPQGLGLWVVFENYDPSVEPPDESSPVGCAGLLPVGTAAEFDPSIAGLIEPLVALAPGAWGRGYAVEALTALLHYAVETLGLETLAGVTDVPNVASDRMLRRAGFTPLREVPGPRYAMRTYIWRAAGAATDAPSDGAA